jgi:hypothetical protein
MGDRSTNRSVDLSMMTTTGFRSPSDKALNYQSPPNTIPTHHPKSLFSTLIQKHGTNVPGDNMDENNGTIVLPKPRPDSSRAKQFYTKNNLTIPL